MRYTKPLISTLALVVFVSVVAIFRAVGQRNMAGKIHAAERNPGAGVTEDVSDQGVSVAREATRQRSASISFYRDETFPTDRSNKIKAAGFLLKDNYSDGTCIYSDFAPLYGLDLNGSAHQSGDKLRLTRNWHHQTGSAWCINKQFVQQGFETTFQFQITGWSTDYGSADGFAFVIQNSSLSALGGSASHIGYGDGITNSLAIEFDPKYNVDRHDPADDHIGVQTCGTDPNSAYHNGCSLGFATAMDDLDVGVHTAKIRYLPGTMEVFLDDSPVLTVSVYLTDVLNLDDGNAWVGFTAATEDSQEDGWGCHDILSWAFYPAFDLSIEKFASVDAVKVDTSLTYTITVANYGPLEVTGVVLTDTFPPTVTLDLDSVTSSLGDCSGTPILPRFVCNLNTLSSSATVTITASVTPTTAGMITNIASVAENEADPNLDNNTAIDNTPICIPPTASFTAAPRSGEVPLCVDFTDTSTGTVNGWHWDFGDGQSSGGQNPTHCYESIGNYTVTLTASCFALYPDTLLRSHYITVTRDHPPVASVYITPSVGGIAPDDATLYRSYSYDDQDGDPEGNTYTIWTQNGYYQPLFYNKPSVPYTYTSAGEKWCAAVTPCDQDLVCGVMVEDCVYIEYIPNRRPVASNVVLTPTFPTILDSLELTYDFDDDDEDPEGDTQIRWYRGDQSQSTLTGTVVPSDTLKLGEIWYATVRPHDGKEYGDEVSSNYVVIGPTDNHPPVATNVIITPTRPKANEDLKLLYEYYDPDDDSEGHTQIRWFREGYLQPAYNDTTIVPAVDTVPGDIWHATIRPYDGKDYGVLVGAAQVFVKGDLNMPPEVRDVRITPLRPGNDSDLYLTYAFLDVDGDPQADSQIRWHKNGAHQVANDDVACIPASDTAVGDTWYAIVIPYDGHDYGVPVPSNLVTVGESPSNTPPEAHNVYLSPGQPGEYDCLELHYTYFDADGDPEWTTVITWTLDGTLQITFTDQTVVPANATSVGESWCASVVTHDGEEPGLLVESNCITIAENLSNTPPEAQNVYIEPGRPRSGDRLRLHYTYFDVDGDSESDSAIHWYRDGDRQTRYDDQTAVAECKSAGAEWYATVGVHDGVDYGTVVTTPIVRVNRLPQVFDSSITPARPNTCQSLNLTYVYSDADGDFEGSSLIEWYLDGELQTDYSGQRYLSFRNTTPDDLWYAIVTPHDGFDFGFRSKSNEVTIAYAECYYRVYLPQILRNYPLRHDPFYEDNDTWKEAYGPLLPTQSYDAYPDDAEDFYYFELVEPSSISVQVTNYGAAGQLQVHYYNEEEDDYEFLCYDYRPPTMTVPNETCSGELDNLSTGTYYVRVTSITTSTQLYKLVWDVQSQAIDRRISVLETIADTPRNEIPQVLNQLEANLEEVTNGH